MASRGYGRLVLVAALVLVPCLPALAATSPAATMNGETWETTVQMTMQGMSLPAQTQKVCQPSDVEAAPPAMPKDGKCEMQDVRITGSRVSWQVECREPEPMSGTGEIVYDGRASYSGTMTMKASMGEMIMKLSGRRLGDPCDAGALERQVVALQAAAEQSRAGACKELASSLYTPAFTGENPQCTEAADKETLCRTLRTEEGFGKVDTPDGTYMKDAAALCGIDAAALRAELCAGALASESLDFLGKRCPEEAATLAQRECAGRKYTALTGSKYQGFCVSYAAELLGDGPEADSATAEEDGALKKAKKKLGGLLRR